MTVLGSYVEKWSAFLEGLDGSQRSVVAWLLEREIRHLEGEIDAGEPKHPVGERAKVHLPVLRLAACCLLPASAVDQLGRLAAWPQGLTVEEVEAAVREALFRVEEANAVQGGRTLKWRSGEIGVGPQIRELAERTYEALLAYPGEVR